jgi:hypothetical protein
MAGAGVHSQHIVAVDLAPRPNVCDRLARTIRGVDFIDWAKRNAESVDHVVMNPPWVALSKLGGIPRRNALSVELADGHRVTLGSNYWCPFLLRATACVRPGGTLTAILPAAWDFAQYARRVREEVLAAFGHVTIIRSMSPLFPTVKDGAIVLVCRDRGAKRCQQERVEVRDLAATVQALEELANGRRTRGSSTLQSIAPREVPRTRLDSIVAIGIGAVTGDSTYFLLSEPQRKALGLPLSALRPVLTRSKHLVGAVMTTREWRKLKGTGERVWLFRPSKAARNSATVKSYLWHGARGTCNMDAFKVASRPTWHQTVLPAKVDAFISGMSMNRLPYLVLRGMAGLTASNTLYVVRFRRATSTQARAALGLLLLTSEVRRELRRHARTYADGLLKFEPRELGKTLVPVVRRYAGALETFKQATAFLLSGRERDAEALADRWVSNASSPKGRPLLNRLQAPGRNVA